MSNIIKQHMSVHWNEIAAGQSEKNATDASLKEKATLVGRVGMMMLSVGTGAWRVRNYMNEISRNLKIGCFADIGLVSIECTCVCDGDMYTQCLSIPTSGINTDKLYALEKFVSEFPEIANKYSVRQIHEILDEIQKKKENYKAPMLGLAAGIACGSFAFLLGGGWAEIICAFLGAGVGNFTRKKMLERKISLFANVSVSVAAACFMYVFAVLVAQNLFGISAVHQAGYICAMLYVIPGFPLITGGIDMAKLDMRSGLERTSYAVMIIVVATMTGWATAMICRFRPADFAPLEIAPVSMFILRAVASFFGVYNFSLMFNSTRKMALTAGIIGMISNTLRLEIIDYLGAPAGLAAFIGAFCSGIIASVVKKKIGFPRITLTVPSIVIMVPGLFMYRGIYHLGLADVGIGALWLTKAILIVVALPMGLVAARLCTDKNFRHCT